MSNVIEPGHVVPTPQPVKTLGLLNIVFGSVLLLLSLIGILSVLMMLYTVRMMRTQQKTMERKLGAEQDAQTEKALARLDDQLKSAKTDAEKGVIVARKQQLKNRPKPFTPDMTVGVRMVNDPVYRRYQWGDYATGIPLNVAMLISGIGLLRLKRWGRRVANVMAALKLSRAVILLVVTVLFVAPSMTKFMGQTFDDMGRQIAAQQPAKAQQIKQTMTMMTHVTGAIITGMYVAIYLLAMIYPVVLLVLLNKPGARAALVAKPVAGGETLT